MTTARWSGASKERPATIRFGGSISSSGRAEIDLDGLGLARRGSRTRCCGPGDQALDVRQRGDLVEPLAGQFRADRVRVGGPLALGEQLANPLAARVAHRPFDLDVGGVGLGGSAVPFRGRPRPSARCRCGAIRGRSSPARRCRSTGWRPARTRRRPRPAWSGSSASSAARGRLEAASAGRRIARRISPSDCSSVPTEPTAHP